MVKLLKTERNKKLYIIGGIGLLCLLIFIYLFYYNKATRIAVVEEEIRVSDSCDGISQRISDNSGLFISNDRSQLLDLVTEIEAIDGYRDDQNCLIPLIGYYLGVSNLTKAEEYLAQLDKVNDDGLLNESLRREPSFAESYRKEVDVYRSIQNTEYSNDYGVPIVYPEE